MEDKISNSIAKHQGIINELEVIKDRVKKNIDTTVKFRIETRQIFKAWEPYISKCKDKMNISPDTMLIILDETINVERERINVLIDMEIDRRLNNTRVKD